MILDLEDYSLLQLYSLLDQQKKGLDEHLATEPSEKKKQEHALWEVLYRAKDEDIQRIKMAINEKREKMGLL